MSYCVDVIEGSDPRTGVRKPGSLRFATMDEADSFSRDTYPRGCGLWGVIGESTDEPNAAWVDGQLVLRRESQP